MLNFILLLFLFFVIIAVSMVKKIFHFYSGDRDTENADFRENSNKHFSEHEKFSERNHKKVFRKDEGEYIEFEEIPEVKEKK